MDYRELYEIPQKVAYDIVKNNKGQPVGVYYTTPITGKKIYSTRRTEEHFFRKFVGIGIDTKILKSLFEKTRIKIIYEGRHGIIRYFSNLEDWFTHGVDVNYGDYGPQIILGTKYMRTDAIQHQEAYQETL